MPVMDEETYHFLYAIHEDDCHYAGRAVGEPCFARDPFLSEEATTALSPCEEGAISVMAAGFTVDELYIAILRFSTVTCR